MYIKHTVHIDHSVDDCVAAMTRGQRTWFPGLKGDRTSRVGVKIAGVPVRKRVKVELGNLVREGSWAAVPITWKATAAKPFFPIFNGKLELAPVDVAVTRMTVTGMYKPPLGRLGLELDQAFMHNVAKETLKELVESISSRLEKAAD